VEIPFELEKSFFMLFGKELHPVLVSLFQSLPATASYNISANCVGANQELSNGFHHSRYPKYIGPAPK